MKAIQDFSFLGTGDDIKGEVYEIFLKNTLRGDLDQYFTPREIVEFMVKFSDPGKGTCIVDPACGSGGFLIQSFRHVNQKIIDAGGSETERRERFRTPVDNCLWGQEADYDLHVLAKINLIMHGDGWNSVFQGDSLNTDDLPDNRFDLVLTNPPFTIRYEYQDVLSRYELGIGRDSQELDLLFVEKGIRSLKAGGDLYIVLPEGMLNNARYLDFRLWLFNRCHMLMVVSLPQQAFQPFGKSVSKTCILGVRKKTASDRFDQPPRFVFACNAEKIGYECGKKTYKAIEENDLLDCLAHSRAHFDGVRTLTAGGECGWIPSERMTERRIDARSLLNMADRARMAATHATLVRLGEVCKVENRRVKPAPHKYYNYLEVPQITEHTGTVTNVVQRRGNGFVSETYNFVTGGDLLFVRINPRLNRVALLPDGVSETLVSDEVYRLVMEPNPHIQSPAVLAAVLRSTHVKKQMERIATGSSSSRARVQPEDLLNEVFIPVPPASVQRKIETQSARQIQAYWKAAQEYLKHHLEIQEQLDSHYDPDTFKRV
ncbi:N-6 DNA methylase [Thermodesulfobacteriota bacterium]